MSFPELYINFKGKSGLLIEFETMKPLKTKKDPIPFWASFDHMSCPGNIKHGPEIDHCSLSVEINTLIIHLLDLVNVEGQNTDLSKKIKQGSILAHWV